MSCRNVYKAGGFITRYGSLQAYRKVLAKKDGNLIHAKFLACLKACWSGSSTGSTIDLDAVF